MKFIRKPLIDETQHLNKFTLSFQNDLERLFLNNYYDQSIVQFRLSFILVLGLYGLFGFLDTLLVKEFAQEFHLIRFIGVIPFLGTVLALSFFDFFRKVWQQLIFVSFIVAGTGIIIMTILLPDNYAYYAGMMLIYMAGYFFIRLRFFLATIAGISTLLIYNVGSLLYAEADWLLILTNNFFFVSANLIGMFAAYNIEYYARRNFILNYRLDLEKKALEQLNANLEDKVQLRTAELNSAKNRAEESDRLKTAFLANMSHEIRTPMNGILGFAQLLKDPELSGSDQQEYLSIIEKSGFRMLNIINDIVNISKIESGIVELFPEQFSLKTLIADQCDFFLPHAQSKNLVLTNKTQEYAPIMLFTDKFKLESILSNLIKNAIKYTKTGAIEIGYTRNDLGVKIYVKDTGIGIPKDRHKAVFERFVQADIADKMALQGAGLGLAISKAYAAQLKGKIYLESEVGKGSVFYLEIPYSLD